MRGELLGTPVPGWRNTLVTVHAPEAYRDAAAAGVCFLGQPFEAIDGLIPRPPGRGDCPSLDARIDPKPYVGDPHYDVLQHLLNCDESLRADPITLLTEVADLAGLDPGRVRQWLFARCVQECLGDGSPWRELDVVLQRLGGP